MSNKTQKRSPDAVEIIADDVEPQEAVVTQPTERKSSVGAAQFIDVNFRLPIADYDPHGYSKQHIDCNSISVEQSQCLQRIYNGCLMGNVRRKDGRPIGNWNDLIRLFLDKLVESLPSAK